MNDKLLIGLTGDVMIGRNVDKAITQMGYAYPLGDVLPLLRSTAINIINLETTLTHSTTQVPKVFNFKATPDKVNTLLEARITAATLANNHILDYDIEGLAETIHTLQQAGILYTGAGMTEQEATRPCIITYQELRVGLLGFTDNEPSWRAKGFNSGTNYIAITSEKDQQRALSMVQEARKEVDLLIVSLHWGPNMRQEPPRLFMSFAHQLIHEGADVVHGHSAHIFQGVEIYQHKLILYDTGDFIDDYVVNPMLRNDLSFLFLLEVSHRQVVRLQLVPVVNSQCQVNLAKGSTHQWCIQRMQHLSAAFATQVSNDGMVVVKDQDR